MADDEPVALNVGISASERTNRLESFYEPFHDGLSNLVEEQQPRLLMSVHSFTPVYEGTPREVEMGVLYSKDSDKELATELQNWMVARGVNTALNEPWSGMEGIMHSVDHHSARSRNCRALMIEVRQDLAVDQRWRSSVADSVSSFLRHAISNILTT